MARNNSFSMELMHSVQKEKREKVQSSLAKFFSFKLSLAIEKEIHTKFSHDPELYIKKAFSIRQNINPLKNKILYNALIANDISVDFLVGLSVQDMATGEKIKFRNMAKQDSLFQSTMTEQTRIFQRSSILFEDSTKKTKLFPNSDSVGNF
jgi:hypothetical protein